MKEKKHISRPEIFKFIYGFARPYLTALIIGTIFYSLQMVTFPLMNSVLMGGVTEAMTTGDTSLLLLTALRVFGLTAFAMISVFIGVLLFVKSSVKTTQRLQIKMLRTFIGSGSNDNMHSGEKLVLFNNDVNVAH